MKLSHQITYFILSLLKKWISSMSPKTRYKLSNKLELSACILSNNVVDILNNSQPYPESSILNFYCAKYCVPVKSREKEYYTLKYEPFINDKLELKDAVYKSFWAHNKTIPHSVQKKIDNTDKYFRFLKIISIK